MTQTLLLLLRIDEKSRSEIGVVKEIGHGLVREKELPAGFCVLLTRKSSEFSPCFENLHHALPRPIFTTRAAHQSLKRDTRHADALSPRNNRVILMEERKRTQVHQIQCNPGHR